jgi:hypothetical protein
VRAELLLTGKLNVLFLYLYMRRLLTWLTLTNAIASGMAVQSFALAQIAVKRV